MRRLMDWQDLAVGLAKQNRQRYCDNRQEGWMVTRKGDDEYEHLRLISFFRFHPLTSHGGLNDFFDCWIPNHDMTFHAWCHHYDMYDKPVTDLTNAV